MTLLSATPIRTSRFELGGDLLSFVVEHLAGHLKDRVKDQDLRSGGIVAITSKIVSLAERAVVMEGSGDWDKRATVEREADRIVTETRYGSPITLKHGMMMAAAGIDESNLVPGVRCILLPRNPYASAEALCRRLRERLGLDRLGVILTDSHSQPLRRGVTGVGLSHWGFRAVKDLRGEKDLSGRPLQMTSINILDALATAAVLVMGEAAESTPLAWVESAAVDFFDGGSASEVAIAPEDDLYAGMFGDPSGH